MQSTQATQAPLHHAAQGQGPAVILLHGLLMDSQDWFTNGLVALLAQSHQVICPDLLAHGGSSKSTDPADYEQRHQAARVVALMDQLGLDKAQVLGYSSGAWLALGLAKYYPERLSAVVIAGWDIAHGLPQGPDGPLSFDAFLAFARQTAPHVSAWVTPADEPSLRLSFEALQHNQGMDAVLPGLALPTLLWAGRGDIYFQNLQAYAHKTGLDFFASEGDHLSAVLDIDAPTTARLHQFLLANAEK